MAATTSVAFTGTRRVGCTVARKPGSWRSRAIANSSREVAAWATSELAKPQAIAVATAVSVASHAPAGDAGGVVEGRACCVALGDQLVRVRDQERGDPGLDDEQDAGQRERGDHRLADVPRGLLVLLGEGRDAVEAEEAEHGDGDGAEDELQREGVAVVDRREVEAAPLAGGEGDHADDQEDRQHDELADEHDLVDPCGELDAEVVDDGVEDDEGDQPDPAPAPTGRSSSSRSPRSGTAGPARARSRAGSSSRR